MLSRVFLYVTVTALSDRRPGVDTRTQLEYELDIHNEFNGDSDDRSVSDDHSVHGDEGAGDEDSNDDDWLLVCLACDVCVYVCECVCVCVCVCTCYSIPRLRMRE